MPVCVYAPLHERPQIIHSRTSGRRSREAVASGLLAEMLADVEVMDQRSSVAAGGCELHDAMHLQACVQLPPLRLSDQVVAAHLSTLSV